MSHGVTADGGLNGEMIFFFKMARSQTISRPRKLGDVNILRIKNMFFLRLGGGLVCCHWSLQKKCLQAQNLMVCRVFFC